MKQTKRFLVLTLLMSMLGLNAFAYDAQIDGIYYNFSGSEASVVARDGGGSEQNNTAYTGEITIPSTVEYNDVTYNVTSIDDYAFSWCSGLASITIPNSVTSIGVCAFSDCRGLTTITIPNSVTSIGDCIFTNCTSLISATLSNKLTRIPAGCFECTEKDCSSLTSVSIPNGVTSIGYAAFAGCNSLTSVSIPNSVTSIGDYAFGFNEYQIPYNGYSNLCIWAYNPMPVDISELVFSNRTDVTLYVISEDAYKTANYWKNFEVQSIPSSSTISFLDANVKDICIEHWDTDHDGEISFYEAAAVSTLPNNYFGGNTSITSFDELAYFTGLTSIDDGAFYSCTSLNSIKIPNSVTSIDEYAFFNCRSLTSITIPKNVTSIDGNAFYFCIGLTSINVESGNTVYDSRNNCNAIIETLTNELFLGCSGTTIPNSVTRIGINAFQDCRGLTSVTIPASVTSIDNYAFYGCCSLTSIIVQSENAFYDSRDDCNAIIETATNKLIVGCKNTAIPNSVTSIGIYAFGGSSDLISITIPNGVTSIGNNTFVNCSSLTSVTIPNSVISIGESAFNGCSALTSITIPNSVTSIGNFAFLCNAMTSVTVLNPTPIVISEDVFTNCANATLYVPAGSKAAYEAADYWKNFKEVVELPSNNIAFADVNVKAICLANNWDTNSDGEISYDEAAAVTSLSGFSNNTTITSFDELVYFTGVRSLVQDFDGCSNLTSVTLPEGLKKIGWWTFRDCKSLTSLSIPSTVETIYDGFLVGCEAITSLSVAAGNEKFDSRNSCNAIITRVDMYDIDDPNPQSPMCYENTLIAGCKNTVIPNTVKTIWNAAFCGCTGLTSITIPNGVEKLHDAVFQDCSSLTSITISNSVTTMYNNIFAGCSSLTSITIPKSVTSIASDGYLFENCDALSTITVEAGNPTYDSRNDCNAIIEKSSNTLIYGCKNSIIPNDVTTIGGHAFTGCNGLTSITIPQSVTCIYSGAFYDCDNLISVAVLNPTPIEITEYEFPNRANATLVVPDGSLEAYKAANYWKEFKNIVERYITFADDKVKDICVANWDTDDDGLISLDEAAAVTSLSGCFLGRTSITSFDELVYFTGLTSIEDLAFSSCSNLTSINIPNSVTSIGENAFSNCSNLTSINIPNNVTSIGGSAFYGCSSLTSITIPASVTSIGANAFYECRSITNIQVQQGNTYYDSRDNCNAIIKTATNELIAGCGSTVIPNSVTSIGRGAFVGCSGLTSITIPTSVTSIDYVAFYGCSGLTSITIPTSVTSIGGSAFSGCSSLTSITIPANVTSIGYGVFSDCSNLGSIVVESDNPSYDSRNNCHAIIKTSSNELIAGCKNTIIPNNVTTIGGEAFKGCTSLTSITIPASVQAINYGVFRGCNTLKWIHVKRSESVTTLSPSFVFYGCSSLSHIFVPENVGYETAANWSDYAAKMFANEVTLFENNAPNTLMSWCDQFEYTKPAGCTVYGISGVTGNQVNLTAIDGEVIPAYTPVIIQRTEGSLDAPIKAEIYDIADGDDLVSAAAEGATLYGNTTEATITTDDFYAAGRSYVLYPGNKFLRVDTNEGIPAHRCMLTLSSPAATRSLSIGLGGDTTSMDELKNKRTEEQEANNTWYDLQGRPIGGKPSVKGIYIYKGKKLVVK